MTYRISKPDLTIQGRISLDGSKSISNRALIIRALSGKDFPIERIASSKDVTTMLQLLKSNDEVLDTGAAGTTFRFLTAYLSLQNTTTILTGSERMKQRPIGGLVDALRHLGADIEYLEQEGYPPLRINPPKKLGKKNHLSISANVSSQFISALLMIAPCLPNGLTLKLVGKVVSRPYIEMTLRLMEHFGVQHQWSEDTIEVKAQEYQAKPFKVEADWSAASYYYAMAAFSPNPDLYLDGLSDIALQGDAVLVDMMRSFGINTDFTENGIHLTRFSPAHRSFEWDFIRCPDVAQTLAVVCAGLGVEGRFTGLDTLSIKETDRIMAVRNELAKVNVNFDQAGLDDNNRLWYKVSGKAKVDEPVFPTYEDHRMAMAFAPLAMLGDIQIEDPEVVVKSYPDFWKDIIKLDFVQREVTDN